MDLLAPCRSCLQCLPFFIDSPPSSPRTPDYRSVDLPSPSNHGVSDAGNHGKEVLAPEEEEARDRDQKALISSITDVAATETGYGFSATEDPGQESLLTFPSEILTQVATTENRDGDSRTGDPNQGTLISTSEKIIIAPPVVFAQKEGSDVPLNFAAPGAGAFAPMEMPLKVPFINDVDFSTAGLKPPASPMTPAPFGTGYSQIPHGRPMVVVTHSNPRYRHHQGHRHPDHYKESETMAQKISRVRGAYDGEDVSHDATAGGNQSQTENGGDNQSLTEKKKMELLCRAVQQQQFSSLTLDKPEELVQLVSKPIPSPSPGHVVVRMLLSAINPIDIIFLRESRLSAFHHSGAVPGSEGVGIVHEVGEGVSSFQKGERVVPIIYWNYLIGKGQGAWQDYIEVSENDLVSLPESVPNESASLYVINPWTVYGLLMDLAIPKGEYLLQTTGGSVIGRMVIQLGKHWGIKTISIIRKEEWREELYGLGADEIINSSTEDITASVLKITKGRRAYAAIDILAGKSTKVTAACVRDYGNVYVFGTMLSHDVLISASDLMRKVNVTFWNLTRFLSDKDKARKLMEDMPKLFENRILSPLVGTKFSLNDVKDAILELQRGGTSRRVLLSHI